MRPILIACVLALAACTGGANGEQGGSGGLPDGGVAASDAPTAQCSVVIQVTPTSPQVGVDETVRATASTLDVDGTITYAWMATLEGGSAEVDPAAADNSAITIPVTGPGALHIQLTLPDHPECTVPAADVNILPTDFATASYRIRVVPPATTDIPASDALVQVHGGVDTVTTLGVTAPFAFTGGHVVDGAGSGVAAYVRMTPLGAPLSVVEAYSGADGKLPTLNVLGQTHAALIVPTNTALAPSVVQWMPSGTSTFTVGPGTTVAGVVHDPSGQPLVGAMVALTIDGVPSTIGTTTGATAAFTLHATPSAGATIGITVTPPAASGLPRLVASSTAIALGSSWTISYAAALTTRDLSTLHVTRAAAPVANASATIVGAITTAGAINDGTTNVTAAGDVRLVLATDANGALSGRAPAAPLSLVVTQSTSDVSLTAIDLTAAVPASVVSAAPVAVTSTLSVNGTAIAGTHAQATGRGPLAGLVVEATANPTTNQLSLPLAAGGAYDLRLDDPAGRAVPLTQTIASATATDLGILELPASVHLTGSVIVLGSAQSIAGAAVQLLCTQCSGTQASTPIAQGAADTNGRFRLAVPDPGTSQSVHILSADAIR
jgi:hypothetical protein